MGPKVTVGIPTYNQSEYLRQAIRSVLNQTFQDFEIVVVDDCSTDDTAAVVEQFADDRIRYYRTPKTLRPPRSWNECLRLAKGELFSILPHDDLYDADYLRKMVSELDRHPEVGFSQCAYRIMHEDSYVGEERFVAREELLEKGEAALITQTQRYYCNPVSIVFRRKCMLERGP